VRTLRAGFSLFCVCAGEIGLATIAAGAYGIGPLFANGNFAGADDGCRTTAERQGIDGPLWGRWA